MKLSGNFGVSGILAKEDERYQVIDNNTLNNLVLSSTNLNPGHSTSGHKHKGQEEVYICLLYTSPSPRDGLLSRMPSSA